MAKKTDVIQCEELGSELQGNLHPSVKHGKEWLKEIVIERKIISYSKPKEEELKIK